MNECKTTTNYPTLLSSDYRCFRDQVKEKLTKDIDYGIIPHTGNKPSLYKCGAEKIQLMLHLKSHLDIISQYENWELGNFGYTVKCTLSGDTVSEGLGACSTLESRYSKQNGYSLQNTVLKMAKKRAYVDAVLTASGLSDLFTQDLEDFSAETTFQASTTNQVCENCNVAINDVTRDFSVKKFGKPLCYKCQKSFKTSENS